MHAPDNTTSHDCVAPLICFKNINSNYNRSSVQEVTSVVNIVLCDDSVSSTSLHQNLQPTIHGILHREQQ